MFVLIIKGSLVFDGKEVSTLRKKNGIWKYELLLVIVTSETFFLGDLNKNRLLIVVVLYTLGQNFLLTETIAVSRFLTLSAKVYSREIFQNFLSFFRNVFIDSKDDDSYFPSLTNKLKNFASA